MSEAQRRKGKSSYCSSDLKLGSGKGEDTISCMECPTPPQGPLLAAQVLIRSQFILLPPSSAKNDFCYTSGKALSFHSQPNLIGDRSFTCSEVTGCTAQLLNSALQESLQSYWGVSQPPTTSNSNWAPCRADKPWGKQDLDSNDPKRNGIGRDRYHRQ